MVEKYVSGKEASKILGVHQRTLYQWDEKKWIDVMRTPGGKRMYNVDKYIKENNKIDMMSDNEIDELYKKEGKLKLSYVRVSSKGQIDDLLKQKKMIKNKYPNHTIIEDIGSGINLDRRGLRKIIKLAISGKIEELVIAYKDRLTRFGYNLIEDLIKEYSNGKIIVIKQKEDIMPEEEMVKDVLQIMNIFVAKMNGMRKYKKENIDNKI
jgi:predicted site-specific integrase-resolvase